MTESLLAAAAAADRLRKADDGARSPRSRRARDRQRPHVPRVRTRRDGQAYTKAHRATLSVRQTRAVFGSVRRLPAACRMREC